MSSRQRDFLAEDSGRPDLAEFQLRTIIDDPKTLEAGACGQG
jgi:hypothetical protein